MNQNDFPHPQEVSPRIWRLPHPVPTFVSSNSYLIVDKTITMIDCGFHPNQQVILEKQFRIIGCDLGDIGQILYTHHHIDHTGGGSLLSHRFGMRHRIIDKVSSDLRDVDRFYDPIRFMPRRVFRDYPELEQIVTRERRDALAERYVRIIPVLGPFAGKIEAMREGEVVDLGSRQLCVHFTPGHGLYDTMFFDLKNGILFCGDGLLTSSTTFNYMDGGNIRVYLNSMEKILGYGYDIHLILSGHGQPIHSRLQDVIGESRKAIEEYCGRILQCLKRNGAMSAVSIFLEVHGTKKASWLSLFCTLASYLKFLRDEGRIEEITGEYPQYVSAK